jgi:hypothetical protein
MPVPYARTYDEAYLFMDLRPCPCGESEFERSSTSTPSDGDPVIRFTGTCPNCGRRREFSFRMPEELPELDFEVNYGPAAEPSQLLDAGEWLGVAELYEAVARERLGGADERELDNDEVTRIYYLLSSAVAATDEVLKFLPDGAPAVPETAFWSQAGRLVFESSPDRFTREGLVAERDESARRLAGFEEQYGDDEDPVDQPAQPS